MSFLEEGIMRTSHVLLGATLGVGMFASPMLAAITPGAVVDYRAGDRATTFPQTWFSRTTDNEAAAWRMHHRSVTFTNFANSAFPGIQGAYTFPGTEPENLQNRQDTNLAAGGEIPALTGFGSRIEAVTDLDFNGQETTYEMWVQPEDFNGSEILIENGGEGSGFGLAMDGANLLAGAAGPGSGDAPQLLASANVGNKMATDEFNHVVATAELLEDFEDTDRDGELEDAQQMKLYLNNELIATDIAVPAGGFNGFNDTGLAMGSGNNPFHQGLEGFVQSEDRGANAFNGEISQVRIYNGALSAGEIDDNFLAIVPEPTSLALVGLGATMLVPWRRRSAR